MSTVFGFVPLDEHPDRELLADIAVLDAFADEWDSARGERAERKVMQRQEDLGFPAAACRDRSAPSQASTMVGLIAKADQALHHWRGDTTPARYDLMWASLAMCLEQAMATLQALENAPDRKIVGVMTLGRVASR